MSWSLGPRPPALWPGVESPGDRQEEPEARGSGSAPFRVSGGKTTGEQASTVEDAAQLLLNAFGVDYGRVTISAQGGSFTHMKVEHDIQPDQARAMKL